MKGGNERSWLAKKSEAFKLCTYYIAHHFLNVNEAFFL